MHHENQQTIIIGTGFSGLALAIQLKKAGIEDFTLLEQAAGIGGTWRDNTYPGAACDVPSAVYSFSFEQNPHWSRKFSPQEEILAYLNHCADKYGIRPHIRFQHRVVKSSFDEETGLWTVHVAGQAPLICRYLVLCSGGLSRPAYPQIPGLESFQGALFHSARWNHEFRLEQARVAVIGTGASSIQIVPAIAPKVAKLSLFQRTPAWILPKQDKAYGWLDRWLFRRLPGYLNLVRKMLYWQFEIRVLGLLFPFLMRMPEKMAVKHMEQVIANPALRRKLTPNYQMGCKRILLSNDFYPTMNQPHVDVVTDSIARVTPQGVLTQDGTLHEVDAIICATGFQVAEASAPFPILGLEGQSLEQVWADGAEGYLGVAVSGFPNFFTIVGPNTGLGHNSIVFMIEAQARYVVDAIRSIRQAKLKYAEVRREVQDRYNQEIQERFKGTVWTTGGCVSWYHTEAHKNTTLFPGFSFELRLRTKRFNPVAYRLVAAEAEKNRIRSQTRVLLSTGQAEQRADAR